MSMAPDAGQNNDGPLTLGQITDLTGRTAQSIKEHDEKFATLEAGIGKLSEQVDSIQKAVEATRTASDGGNSTGSTSVMVNPDGSDAQDQPAPYTAELVSTLLKASSEPDSAKREAAIKKALGDHSKDMAGKASSRKASMSSDELEQVLKKSKAFMDVTAMMEEYKDAARQPLLEKLASAYGRSGMPEEALKPVMESFKDMDVPELRTEVLKADMFSMNVPSTREEDDMMIAAGAKPFSPQGAYPRTASMDSGSSAVSNDMAFVLDVVNGRTPEESRTASQGGRSQEVTVKDVLNNTLRGGLA